MRGRNFVAYPPAGVRGYVFFTFCECEMRSSGTVVIPVGGKPHRRFEQISPNPRSRSGGGSDMSSRCLENGGP